MTRQKLHLKAPDNWVNDPNGFIYYKGYYHLFYQYFPYEPRWGTMHWGHAVSKDLITWEHKGIALYPSVWEDQNGCFSGSAVESDGRLYLVYTGVRYEVVNPQDPHTCLDEQFESAQLMISSEDGFSFDNEKGKEVIIPPLTEPQTGHRTHTRDPKIWRGKDAWYLVLGSTEEEKYGKILFYRSEDLHTWTYVNQAWKGPEYGWMWECPDLFPAGDGEVLLISAMGLLKNEEREKNQTICFPVEFQEDSCGIEIPDTYQFVDYGMDLYAPQTTLDACGRRVMEAWIRMPKPTREGWIGMFCSPGSWNGSDRRFISVCTRRCGLPSPRRLPEYPRKNPGIIWPSSIWRKENRRISEAFFSHGERTGSMRTGQPSIRLWKAPAESL